MAQPYIGELRMFGGNFAPIGWAMCDGQVLQIASNDTLFVLIGTTYGGDGVNTFALPDLRGRVVCHQGSRSGQTYVIGQQDGDESVILTSDELPAHTHPFFAIGATATVSVPTTATMLADQGPAGTGIFGYTPYSSGNAQIALAAASTTTAGSSQPHENRQPYLGINYIIALEGIFPSQN
jgi:microcystin-dependent protein